MKADLVQGAVWALGGGIIVYASWTMERLERHGAALYTAPGLVPGLLGLVLLVLGVVLALRALRSGELQPAPSPRMGWGNTPAVLVLCFGYAIGLVGHVPFWLATFIFVTAFVALFEYPSHRRMAMAPIYGAATSLIVSYLFEEVFLVRLP